MSADNELVIYPKPENMLVIEPPKTQWYVSEVGEYECPHYTIHDWRMDPTDKAIDLTDDEAAAVKDIEALYDEQQEHLESLYRPGS